MTAPPLLWAYRARLTRVYDGDTVYLVLDLGFGLTLGEPLDSYRLLDVWAKEVRGPERPEGTKAKVWAEGWLRTHTLDATSDWPFVVQTAMERDEHEARTLGRWIVTLWCASCGACLNEDIVAAGFAAKTKGGESEL